MHATTMTNTLYKKKGRQAGWRSSSFPLLWPLQRCNVSGLLSRGSPSGQTFGRGRGGYPDRRGFFSVSLPASRTPTSIGGSGGEVGGAGRIGWGSCRGLAVLGTAGPLFSICVAFLSFLVFFSSFYFER